MKSRSNYYVEGIRQIFTKGIFPSDFHKYNVLTQGSLGNPEEVMITIHQQAKKSHNTGGIIPPCKSN